MGYLSICVRSRGGIADILAREGCRHNVASLPHDPPRPPSPPPQQPRLPSVSPSGPRSWLRPAAPPGSSCNPCSANCVSLQPAMCRVCAKLCQVPAIAHSEWVLRTTHKQSGVHRQGSPLDTLRGLHSPPMHPATPPPSTQRRKDCTTVVDNVARLLRHHAIVSHYDQLRWKSSIDSSTIINAEPRPLIMNKEHCKN